MPFPTITHIDTPRLILRPVTAADLPDLLAVNGDPAVTHFLPYATWQALADGTAWLARVEALAAAGTGQQLVVVDRADSTVIGGLILFKYDEGSQRLEVGYVLRRSHWGRGLMHEAVTAAGTHAFDQLGIRRIEAEANPANLASCRLLLRVGFTLEGTLRQRWVAKGHAYDTNIYGWLAADRNRLEAEVPRRRELP